MYNYSKMNSMKILVYGSNGWIGGQFIDILRSANAQYVKGTARVDDNHALIKELNIVSPTHVISLIGRTHGKTPDGLTFTTIDYLEQKGAIRENVCDNLFAPACLAIICEERSIHLTYLGTGCIFSFNDDNPCEEQRGYTEEDLPTFFGSSYSVVKGYTDQLMHLFNASVLNLRIRMPITGGDNFRNVITKIKTYSKICSIPNSMTVLPDMLPLVFKLMQNQTVGTLNLTNPGMVSHNEILSMYRDTVDHSFTWDNFSLEEQGKILASQRSNNFLDTTKLGSLFPNILDIKDSIRQLLLTFKGRDIPSHTTKQHAGTEASEMDRTDFIKNAHDSCVKVFTKTLLDIADKTDTVLLVTGGYGFIGSHFINEFRKSYKHVKIVVLDALFYCANQNNVLSEIRNAVNFKFIKGNLQSYDLIRHVVGDEHVTHVIHFAAQSHVENSFDNALQYTNDNILGTHNLLEACRLYGKIIKFIHVSTDEVYGESMLNVEEQHKTEQSILCPTNPYAATKAAAELIAQSYYRSFKMPIIITRGNNVYGPGQNAEKVIPKFIQLLKNNKQVEVQGSGSCVRSFIYVSDCASAFIKIMESGKAGEIYNIGGGIDLEICVLDIAKLLIRKIQKTHDYKKWIKYVPDRPFNDQRYFIDNDKLTQLGWEIHVSLSKGLDFLTGHLQKGLKN